jgi:transcriptional regulator with XRE-family HTH domain
MRHGVKFKPGYGEAMLQIRKERGMTRNNIADILKERDIEFNSKNLYRWEKEEVSAIENRNLDALALAFSFESTEDFIEELESRASRITRESNNDPWVRSLEELENDQILAMLKNFKLELDQRNEELAAANKEINDLKRKLKIFGDWVSDVFKKEGFKGLPKNFLKFL